MILWSGPLTRAWLTSGLGPQVPYVGSLLVSTSRGGPEVPRSPVQFPIRGLSVLSDLDLGSLGEELNPVILFHCIRDPRQISQRSLLFRAQLGAAVTTATGPDRTYLRYLSLGRRADVSQ